MTENSSTTHHVDERPAFDVECPECGYDKMSIERSREVLLRGSIGHRRTKRAHQPTTFGCAVCSWGVEIDAETLENIDVFEWEVTRTESILDYEELFEIARECARDSGHDEEPETEA